MVVPSTNSNSGARHLRRWRDSDLVVQTKIRLRHQICWDMQKDTCKNIPLGYTTITSRELESDKSLRSIFHLGCKQRWGCK